MFLKKKPSALLRDILYDFLSKNIPSQEYEEAKFLDDEDWKQSVTE